MATEQLVDPISSEDVPRVDGAIAVGEDLAFQERWWSFERIAWTFFALVLLADVLGVFGAGWFAHTKLQQPRSGMLIKYDRVLRTGTPSSIAIQFGQDAVHDGKVQLSVSDSVVKALGAQRVIPQPETSAIIAGGMLYTFPAGVAPGEVDFELQPSAPTIQHFRLQVVGRPAVEARVLVMP